MIDLQGLIDKMEDEGYEGYLAEARVCQDLILRAIAGSTLNRNVTIKGGVVMRGITGSARRATQDLDLDFIRYSLDDDSIRRFIGKLNCIEGLKIGMTGEIQELSQHEYRGKRVYITIADSAGTSITSKIDFGVHADLDIDQDEFCFDVCMDDEGASLLINSKEQIFVEKLRSLLRFGPVSTRYKDLYDMCYLSDVSDESRMIKYIEKSILTESTLRENNYKDIVSRLKRTFSNRTYRRNVERSSSANWLDMSYDDVTEKLITYISNLPELSEAERNDAVAKQMLDKYKGAFKELSK